MTRTRPRLTIAALMGVVLFVAVGFAALKNSSERVAIAVFSAYVLTLLVVTLGAFLGRGPRWAGFAVFGWGGLLYAFGPWPAMSAPISLWAKGVDAIAPYFADKSDPNASSVTLPDSIIYLTNVTGGGGLKRINRVAGGLPSPPFHQVGQTLCAAMFAFVGAFLAPWMVPKSKRPAIEPVGSPQAPTEPVPEVRPFPTGSDWQ